MSGTEPLRRHSIVLASGESELARLAEFIDDCAAASDWPGDFSFQIRLIVEEIATNAVMHGVFDAPPPEVEVRIDDHEDSVTIAISDNGRPFDPLSIPAPSIDAPLSEREVGGLGIHLVREFADEVRYERDGRFNRLHIRKRTP